MRDGVRYQFYETSDGYVLFQASEREFWENFCRGIGRDDLFEKRPGAQYADHAVGDVELRQELKDIFLSRDVGRVDGARREGQHADRQREHAEDAAPTTRSSRPASSGSRPNGSAPSSSPTPIKYMDVELPVPTKAPTVGEHTDEVLTDVLGYDAEPSSPPSARSGALG